LVCRFSYNDSLRIVMERTGPPGARARSPRLKSSIGLGNSASTEAFLGSGQRRL
jgi:hypothetical protein